MNAQQRKLAGAASLSIGAFLVWLGYMSTHPGMRLRSWPALLLFAVWGLMAYWIRGLSVEWPSGQSVLAESRLLRTFLVVYCLALLAFAVVELALGSRLLHDAVRDHRELSLFLIAAPIVAIGGFVVVRAYREMADR